MTPAKKPKLAFKPRRMWCLLQAQIMRLVPDREAARAEKHFNGPHHGTISPVLVLPADPESVETLVQHFIELTRDQERRCDEGWEPGVGDIAKEYLAAIGFKPKAR